MIKGQFYYIYSLHFLLIIYRTEEMIKIKFEILFVLPLYFPFLYFLFLLRGDPCV